MHGMLLGASWALGVQLLLISGDEAVLSDGEQQLLCNARAIAFVTNIFRTD